MPMPKNVSTPKLGKSFVFRSGKFAGWTYEDVDRINPGYVDWVIKNRPEMLREFKVNGPDTTGMTPREKFNTLMNNNNFLNENK